MMQQRGGLWINHHELDKKPYSKIKDILFGEGKLFDLLGINKDDIPSVQQYQWTLQGDEYQQVKNMEFSAYKSSPCFVYSVDSQCLIPFHLRCYGKYKAHNPQCAIFVEVEEFPENIRKLRIEVDIKCTLSTEEADGKKKGLKIHRQLLKTQILSRDRSVCGFQLFDYQQLIGHTSLEWMIGVKILRAEEFEYDEQEEYLKDLYQIFS